MVFIWSPPGPASCARSGPGASHCLHVGCCTAARAETDAWFVFQNRCSLIFVHVAYFSLIASTGERLFPLIQSMHANLAGKITGMLLEIDNSELLHMLESHESLRSKVLKAGFVNLKENSAKFIKPASMLFFFLMR